MTVAQHPGHGQYPGGDAEQPGQRQNPDGHAQQRANGQTPDEASAAESMWQPPPLSPVTASAPPPPPPVAPPSASYTAVAPPIAAPQVNGPGPEPPAYRSAVPPPGPARANGPFAPQPAVPTMSLPLLTPPPLAPPVAGQPPSSALAPPVVPPLPPEPVALQPPAPPSPPTVAPAQAQGVPLAPPVSFPLGMSLPGDPAATGTAQAYMQTVDVSAWFGSQKVLEKVSLTMYPGQVTALIGPSGCGKSTFLRILNRMHELIPGSALSGRVLLDGTDIYSPERRVTETRLKVGMVFQKPNPFPSMTIAQNVLSGLRLAGIKVANKDALVHECLERAGLWRETRNRLNDGGMSLSGGQQQRLCIARALAVRPRVLLMDEPCSALDPISTGVIEETIKELSREVTIIIVTHNMQQAQRVSDQCALFLLDGEGQPGHIVEAGPTTEVFGNPRDPRTSDYVHGRFG